MKSDIIHKFLCMIYIVFHLVYSSLLLDDLTVFEEVPAVDTPNDLDHSQDGQDDEAPQQQQASNVS